MRRRVVAFVSVVDAGYDESSTHVPHLDVAHASEGKIYANFHLAQTSQRSIKMQSYRNPEMNPQMLVLASEQSGSLHWVHHQCDWEAVICFRLEI